MRNKMLREAPTLTRRWTPLKFHQKQAAYANSLSRFCVVPPGRRSGKSELAKRLIVRRALMSHVKENNIWYSPYTDPRYFAAAPTVQQVKSIYWEDIIALIPPHLMWGRPNASTLTIKLLNGARIQLLGMDRPERAEGVPWDGGVLDEYGNMKEDAWSAHLRPSLSDRRGWCHFIGVPEGRNHYYDLFCEAQSEMIEAQRTNTIPEWAVYHWTSLEILPLYNGQEGLREIQQAKKDLDDITFRQEYEGCHLGDTLIGGIPIREINGGETVCGARILNGGYTGEKDCIEVLLENGETFRASKFHKMKIDGKQVLLADATRLDKYPLFTDLDIWLRDQYEKCVGLRKWNYSFPSFREWLSLHWKDDHLKLTIIEKKDIGVHSTFNIDVDSADHSYLLDNGFNNYNSFENFTGRAYYGFTDDNKRALQYDLTRPIHLSLDFNVEPCVAVVMQEQMIDGHEATCVLSEVFIPRGGNVLMVCKKFAQDFPSQERTIFLYGDATGGARGAGKILGSEWELVRRVLRGAYKPSQISARVPRQNPRERDRISSLNSRCCNTEGERRLFVDPFRAPNTVKDFEGVTVIKGGSGELNKSDLNLTHLTDAVGYYTAHQFPIKKTYRLSPNRKR